MSLKSVGLKKIYGKRVVAGDISINVEPGEIVGLLGPNGAGKTTTFYMIVGMVRPTSGEVFIDGLAASALPIYLRARHGVGYLPQEPSIFRNLTVEENLMAILEMLGTDPAGRKKKMERSLEEMGLSRLAKSKAWQLSGGEKRRCEVARALLSDPKYLLLDEPFVGIDPKTVADIQEIIKNIKSRGLGVLITDHNVRETLSVTDRSYIMYDGSILMEGAADELANSSKVREVYLGERFKM
ncbi:MAG: LPS export ABC transporter ATP-binding protein [Elusimicrobia bacterium HGW-Elusimicrobia-1]|jgi:lipopolysaccharide export system ATP-binding protein|nr:MAG: LPS export ABC transporter ATP-binding protein [Elusimicrobia bacterium HGW-Elusimicrobia-1]